MNPSPPDWPRISSALYYQDPATAIDWLCNAFGFEIRIRIEGEDGSIVHSELEFGEGLIMVGGEQKDGRDNPIKRRSPRSIGGANTQNMMIYVDDIEGHCQRAREAGATIISEPTTVDYGEDYWSDRGYEAEDPEGHRWWFAQRLRNPPTK